MINKVLHNCVLVLVECNILIIQSLLLIIIMWVLQLAFCLCGLPGPISRVEKLLMVIKDTAQPSCVLFLYFTYTLTACAWKSLRSCDTLRLCQSWMYCIGYQHTSYLPIPEFDWGLMLHQLWGSGNHLFIKFQGSIISRQDTHHLGILSDHIGQWNTLHSPNKLEVEHYGLHGLAQLILPTLHMPRA